MTSLTITVECSGCGNVVRRSLAHVLACPRVACVCRAGLRFDEAVVRQIVEELEDEAHVLIKKAEATLRKRYT
jgi:hypothetical protein